MACFGRLMIGFGAAFGTTSYMKLSDSWFPPQYFPLLSGLFGTACMAGAGTAQAPLAWLISLSNWRHALLLCAAVGFVLCLLFFLLAQDHPKSAKKISPEETDRFTLAHFTELFKNRSNWPLLLYGGFAFTPISVFGGLWAHPI